MTAFRKPIGDGWATGEHHCRPPPGWATVTVTPPVTGLGSQLNISSLLHNPPYRKYAQLVFLVSWGSRLFVLISDGVKKDRKRLIPGISSDKVCTSFRVFFFQELCKYLIMDKKIHGCAVENCKVRLSSIDPQ